MLKYIFKIIENIDSNSYHLPKLTMKTKLLKLLLIPLDVWLKMMKNTKCLYET